MADPAEPEPRLVQSVVVGYDLNALPPALIRAFMVLRRKVERAGFQVEVSLRALPDLPPELDVLFVAGELVAAAQQRRPGVEVRGLDLGAGHQPAFDQFVDQLQAGQTHRALPRLSGDAQPASAQRVTVRYRGNSRLY